jgi:hypothetical protein
MSGSSLRGTVLYLYAFDVANEIRTAEVREVLSERPTAFRLRPTTGLPLDVRVYEPLLISTAAEQTLSSLGQVELAATIKVFDIGALSIAYQVPFTVASLQELVPFHRLEVAGRSLSEHADALCDRLAAELRPYMEQPSATRSPAEPYTVFCLSAIRPLEDSLEAWAQRRREEIAALLAEEALGRLSSAQVAETTRLALSYGVGDLAVIDWDAALAVDLSGSVDDVVYVMELANLQLDEFRTVDDRLDAVVRRAYDDVERHYARRPHGRVPVQILAGLRTIRVDLTKITEEASNITKFVGDWYLARVYLACKDRFHIGHWQASVAGKLQQLDDLYSLVRSEVEARRMLVLEATIVALFVIDLILIVLLRR